MNMFKKNGGFTLVELIVVIAILAILAGVAVPAYTGYINKAEEAADMQVLASINTAMQGTAAGKGATIKSAKVTPGGADGYTLSDIVTNPSTVSVTHADVVLLTGKVTFKNEKINYATWNDGTTSGTTEGWTITYKTN